MIKRFFAIALLMATLLGMVSASVLAKDPRQPEVNNLWAFGDSLTDTGNLFFLSGGVVPPSPPYFNGRFSDGPVWIEGLANRLGLMIDFNTPVFVDALANNRAIAGAFTGYDGESAPGLGVLSQVDLFLTTVGSVQPDDLVVIWAGANDYFFTDTLPPEAVGNLVQAVTDLALMANARRFVVPNLPSLGETPLGKLVLTPEQAAGLNALTTFHNSALAESMSELEEVLDVEIAVVNVNAAFAEVIKRQKLFGYDNVTTPCLIQQQDGTRPPTGACGFDPIDSTGTLFWDLIHPTGSAHELLAAFTHATLVANRSLPETVFNAERISTQIALGKLRAAGAVAAPRP